MSNSPSSKGKRSVMSAFTMRMEYPSREATAASESSWRRDMSITVQRAPRAANTGICWPPPDASPSSFLPRIGPNHSCGTGFVGVRCTSQSPRSARSYTSCGMGLPHSQPSATQRSMVSAFISVYFFTSSSSFKQQAQEERLSAHGQSRKQP